MGKNLGLYKSVSMKNILQAIDWIAMHSMGVMLVGELGVEKDWVAKLIHDLSSRRNNNYIYLDCQNIQPDNFQKVLFGEEKLTNHGIDKYCGLLESANGGTIFLDNFTSIPFEIQNIITITFKNGYFKRIGGFEEILINVRPITGINMKEDVYLSQTNSYQNNYLKIYPVCINIPPLRERKEDILFLVQKFFNESNLAAVKRIKGFSKDVFKVLKNYSWPGNTKQLFDVINYSIMMCDSDVITLEHLPASIRKYSIKPHLSNVEI